MRKKHRLLIIFIPASLAIAVLLLVTLGGQKPGGPIRISLPSFAAPAEGSLETERCQLEWNHPQIYFQDGGQKSTFLGSVFNKPDQSHVLGLTPRLKGSFFLDFYLSCLPGSSGRIVRISLTQERGDAVIHETTLRSDRNLQRFQVRLNLEKKDRLSLHIPGGIRGFVTRPLFYRPAEPGDKPRFVFLVVADTLRYDDIGIYNPEADYTPAIDGFARDALVFQQAYSTSPWTLPAHASMLTGLNSTRHRINHRETRLDSQHPALTTGLQEKFITYSINGNGFLSSLYGFARGFDFYREDPVDHLTRQASQILFKRARKLVNNEKHSHSFHFLHTYQIHAPYLPENLLFRKLYGSQVADNQFDFKELIQDRRNLYGRVSDAERQRIKKIYNGGVYTFDYYFGKFLDFLRSKGLYRDAMIILTSDHGEEFLDHGAWLHGHSLYNELIRIPLIVKLPGNEEAGTLREDPVSITDLIPTVFDQYRLRPDFNTPMDGRSLLDPRPERTLVSYLGKDAMQVHLPAKLALIQLPYKFIYNEPMSSEDRAFFIAPPPDTPEYQLFNVVRDPGEGFNVIHNRPGIREKFLEIMKSIRLEGQDRKQVDIEKLKKSLETLGYI